MPWQARWDAIVPIAAGRSEVVVRAIDVMGFPVAEERLTVERGPLLTPLPERVEGDVDLVGADGPFAIEGTVTVASGATLSIEAGATIEVAAGSRLVVEGTLRVVGTTEAPVVFRTPPCEPPWDGIELRPGSAAATEHLLVGVDFTAATLRAGRVLLDVVACDLAAHDIRIDTVETAIAAQDATVALRGAEVVDCVRGIVAVDSDVQLVGCLFERVEENSVDATGDPDDLVAVENCSFRDIRGDAIAIRGVALNLARNRIRGALNGVAAFDCTATLHGNLITDCTAGLAFGPRGTVVAEHDTIAANAIGIAVSSDPDEIERVFVGSAIVWANGTASVVEAGAELSFSYSDVQDGPPRGPGNITADPLFVDPAAGDFRPAPGSPVIGTGRDGTDMGAFDAVGMGTSFVRGDADRNEALNLSDAIRILDWLFRGGSALPCSDAGDVDDDGGITLTDAVRLLNWLFLAGAPPAAPWPDAGTDATDDGLDCAG